MAGTTDCCSEAGVDTTVKGRSLEILQGHSIIPRRDPPGDVPYSTSVCCRTSVSCSTSVPRSTGQPSQRRSNIAVESPVQPLHQGPGAAARRAAGPCFIATGRPGITEGRLRELPVPGKALASRFKQFRVITQQSRCESSRRRSASAPQRGGKLTKAALHHKVLDGGPACVEHHEGQRLGFHQRTVLVVECLGYRKQVAGLERNLVLGCRHEQGA